MITAASEAGLTVEVPALRRYLGLWLVLAAITLAVVVMPDLPVAIHEPRLSVAVGSISGVVGLALLQLGVLRFRVLHRPIDLHAGLAFGMLAASNLFVVSVGAHVGNGELALEPATYIVLLLRGVAAGLFVFGLVREWQGRRNTRTRPASASATLAWAAAIGVLTMAVVINQPDRLPPLLDPSAHAHLARGEAIADLLPGQQPSLILANALIAAALLVSAIGYTVEGQRLRDPHLAALAAGLTIIFFGQVQALLFPPVPDEYVGTPDGFRLVAYGLLLSSLVWRTARDVAASASQAERLRLSRELHDGLAQELAMLGLRLGRVAEATKPSDHHAHDLDVAQRMLESATLEARQAIASLRCDRVTWGDFAQALVTFAAAYSLTHDLDAQVWVEPADLSLDGGLQAEVLRLLREAFSNATRHGCARRIEARVGAEGGVLRLVVRDDGCGFDPARARHGVGLRSMAERVEGRNGQLVIDAAPGRGTRISACLPLVAPGHAAA